MKKLWERKRIGRVDWDFGEDVLLDRKKKQNMFDKQMKKKREEGMRNIVDRWHHQGMNLDYYYYPRVENLWQNDIFIGILGLLLFLSLVSMVCVIFFV